MKFTAAILTLLATSVSAQTAVRQPVCPAFPTTATCPEAINPVECGDAKCLYATLCRATSSGFAETDCLAAGLRENQLFGTPGIPAIPGAVCSGAPTDTVCPEALNPVECGPDDCLFATQCLATAAGYAEDDCRDAGLREGELSGECPLSNPGVICDGTINAVECGGKTCLYGNQCLAGAAGFREGHCRDAGMREDELTGGECPLSNPDVVCDGTINAVECGDKACLYGNQCLAGAAGFQEGNCRDAGMREDELTGGEFGTMDADTDTMDAGAGLQSTADPTSSAGTVFFGSIIPLVVVVGATITSRAF